MRKIALLIGLVLALATTVSAGWEYTALTHAEGGKGSDAMRSSIKGWADGAKSRVEFVDSGNPMIPTGSYLISRDGGKVIYLVNPKDKTYATWDMDSMMGMAGGAMQMMGMKFSAPKVEKLLEQKGPAIHGFPTTHYRFRSSYTMEVNFMGFRRSTETVTEEEIWATKELKDEGLNVFLSQKGVKTGNAELDKLLEAEMNKVQGLPLKRQVTTTTQESGGKPEVTKLSSEITSIRKANVPASQFEMPAGYTEKSMFPGFDAPADSGKDDSGAQENPFLKMLQQRKR